MIAIHGNVGGTPSDTPVLVLDDGCRFDGDLSVSGRASFRLPDGTPPHGAWVHWDAQAARILLAVQPGVPLGPGDYEGGQLLEPLPALAYGGGRVTTGRLWVDGQIFRRETDNQREVVALHSDFKLLRLILDGVDIDPLLDQRFAARSRGPRVFVTCGFLFELDPRRYGAALFDAIVDLEIKLRRRQGYGELTVFTDQQMDLFRGFDRQGFWREVCERTAGGPWLIELVNEYFKNGIDPHQFSPVPNGCPQSPGSFVDGMAPPSPAWTAHPDTYNTFHDSRGWKWPVTMGVTTWELQRYPGGRVATLCNEPIGAAEYDQHEKRTIGPPELFEKKGRDIATWAAGGCFHSQAGLVSEPWGPIQTACAEAFFRGLRA